MPNKNKQVTDAKVAKNDEFYTQLETVEKEMAYYKDQLKDKVIMCNCDDYKWSNFYKYFNDNFEELHLKRLICTHCEPLGGGLFGNPVYWMDVYYKDGELVHEEKKLKGNGDFRSLECINLMKEADFVITNPPFSLFHEFIALLTTYNKQFSVIGNMNAVTYKEVFSLVRTSGLRCGVTLTGNTCIFHVPEDSTVNNKYFEDGVFKSHVNNAMWFTNVKLDVFPEEVPLDKEYNEADYPKYDNYNAINVDKISDIPKDYFDCMGVPVSFFGKWNPNQFDIIGVTCTHDRNPEIEKIRTNGKADSPRINGKELYKRIIIRRKK